MKKFVIVAVAALAVAACHREGPSDENSVNIVADNAYENMMPDESVLPVDNSMLTNAENVADAPVPPPSIDEQQQMQEDADATGMTSRTDRQADAGAQNSADAAVEQH